MTVDNKHTMGAFAVILDEGDRVLLSHRRDLDLWNLPGGQVEVGELPNVAVVREVKEETGLDVEMVRLTGVYGRTDGRADIVLTFLCRVVGGVLTGTDEADRHEWFAVSDLPVNTMYSPPPIRHSDTDTRWNTRPGLDGMSPAVSANRRLRPLHTSPITRAG